ncbi:MAG: hypothetical protein KJ697_00370 [Nanoarchaeota archaeon]|nr:hypothetical protein [Nanoarchaeota archaeon]
MATKKSKEIKESDEEFLKILFKKKEESAKKISEEINAYSEVGEFREKGKQIGKDLDEREECKKIVEEFKISPPIMESVHINDVSFDFSCKNSNVVKKIELLKKHGFPFITAIKSASTYPVNFKTYGKTYLKRGMQKIYLPETSKPPIMPDSNMGMGSGIALDPKNQGVILQDGDVLGTERDSYIYEFMDTKQNMDNHNTDIIIFPESELRITIQREITHPEPEFMVPEKVPSTIKQLSTNTVNSDAIEGIELIKGLFKISLLRKGKNINKLIAIPSKYPQIEFESTSKMIMKTIRQMAENARKNSPKVADLLMAQISNARSASSGVCDDMVATIELNYDGSLVIFGTPNNIIHRGIGKETKRIDPRKKITLTQSALYETDCSKIKDPRVDLIEKKTMAVTVYIAMLVSKKEFEQNIAKPIDMEAENKKMREEDELMLKNAEEIGDDDLINMAKQKIKTDENWINAVIPKQLEENKKEIERAKDFIRKNTEFYKRDFEAILPAYDSPNESDKV